MAKFEWVRGARRSRLRMVGVVGALALVATACGGDDDDGDAAPSESDGGGGDVEAKSATVVLPFGSCLSFYPLYVAESEGYLEEEGLDVTIEVGGGSAAANQAILTGQGDISLTAPNELFAAAEDADLTAFYSLYQEDTFSLFVPADSDIETVADLEGTTVAYSTPSGGDYTYMEGFLRAAGGLEPEADYTSIAVGDGANYALALRDGSADAISGSFFAGITVETQGTDLRILTDPSYPAHPDLVYAAETEWVEGNADTVTAFGRAMAKGSVYGAEHPEETIDICSEAFAEETADPAFARAVYDRMTEILTLPESADGQWGFSDPEVMATYADIVVELGVVPAGSSAETFSNEFVESFNNFDAGAL